jgi:hypothetical protein
MGLWGTLGKALVGGVGGALTGGALPAVLGGAGALIGGMGSAATSNRGEQDRMNLSRDQIALAARGQDENAQLQRALLELRQRDEGRTDMNDAYNNAMRSALAANMKDVSFNRGGFKTAVPNLSFSGGARPSALGPQGREAAGTMNNMALQKLMTGPAPMQQMSAIEKFQQSEPSRASFWEKLAGPVGMGLNLAGIAAAGKQGEQPATQTGGPQFPWFPTPPLGSL